MPGPGSRGEARGLPDTAICARPLPGEYPGLLSSYISVALFCRIHVSDLTLRQTEKKLRTLYRESLQRVSLSD